METATTQFDLRLLSHDERQAALLIERYRRLAEYAVTWFLPQAFKLSFTTLREMAPETVVAKEGRYKCRIRYRRGRFVMWSSFIRTEVYWNENGRYDGFDVSLLLQHYRINEHGRNGYDPIVNLHMSLQSLERQELIYAPQWQPYVGLLYTTERLLEATEAWRRSP